MAKDHLVFGGQLQNMSLHTSLQLLLVCDQFKLSLLGISAPRMNFLRQRLKDVERDISG
jgi:hypothetical protein